MSADGIAVTLEREVLAAVVDRILPSQGPLRSTVATYVKQTLESAFFHKVLAPMSEGLRLLDDAAREQAGEPFPACSPKTQDHLLQRLQRGELDPPGFPAHQLFEILITLSLEGFLRKSQGEEPWLTRSGARRCLRREAV